VSTADRSGTWADTFREATGELAAGGVDHPVDEARWMLEEVGGRPLHELLDQPVPMRLAARIGALVDRRLAGEPLQYVLGAWSFRGLDVMVDRRVLIPRPETEHVAEVALEEAARLGLRRQRTARSTPARYPVADLGTGSGVLALALLAELPDAEVWATDVSAEALAVARANVAALGAVSSRARLAEGSWFAALPAELRGRLRLIVSNPPYVAGHELAGLDAAVREWEPVGALVSGPTGTEALEAIVTEALGWLADEAVLVCELAPGQGVGLVALARRVGFADASVRLDLNGRERVLVARTTSPGDHAGEAVDPSS
jgi:release factor glutamine methyltransferase